MTFWYKPDIYVIIHVLSGFIGFFYPTVFILSILYHFLQYALNIRLFLFELTYRKGNSLEHTGVKLLEVLSGFLFASVLATVSRIK
jgi:hypothetical protein